MCRPPARKAIFKGRVEPLLLEIKVSPGRHQDGSARRHIKIHHLVVGRPAIAQAQTEAEARDYCRRWLGSAVLLLYKWEQQEC